MLVKNEVPEGRGRIDAQQVSTQNHGGHEKELSIVGDVFLFSWGRAGTVVLPPTQEEEHYQCS